MIIEHIKFRVWNTLNKSWDNPAILMVSNKGFLYYQRDGKHIVSRLTGLKDENGVKIYEGDIIRQTNDSGNGHSYEFLGIVEYNSAGFCLRCLNGAEINSHYSFSHYGENENLKKGEIIGNIFENPELMEEKNEKK